VEKFRKTVFVDWSSLCRELKYFHSSQENSSLLWPTSWIAYVKRRLINRASLSILKMFTYMVAVLFNFCLL
jgi:hypothetical protein